MTTQQYIMQQWGIFTKFYLQLPLGVWDDEECVAVVRDPRGRRLDSFGHSSSQFGGAKLLWPEEALFLMENSRIRLSAQKDCPPLSVSQAYRLLLLPHGEERGEMASRCSRDEYRVFSHLSRAGYRTLRHRTRAGRSGSPEVIQVQCPEQPPPTSSSPITDDSLTDGPLRSLWCGRTQPLLQPREAFSMKDVMEKIRLGNDGRTSCLPSDELEDGLSVAYDLYAPGVTMRKCTPRLPNYRLCVVSGQQRLPCPDTLRRINSQYDDQVYLL